jgi:hypothetical protein
MKNRKLLLTLSSAILVVIALFGLTLPDRKQVASGCLGPHLAMIPSSMPQKNPRPVTPRPYLDVPAWWKPQLSAEQQAQYDNITLKRKFW